MLIAKNAENPDPKFVAPPLETLTLGDKVTMYSEKWYSRYGFAMLYVLSVPVIRDYMNGDDSEEEGEDDDDLETLQMLRMMQKNEEVQKILKLFYAEIFYEKRRSSNKVVPFGNDLVLGFWSGHCCRNVSAF